MASVLTDQGEFEVCDCGNAEGHVGPVFHPGFPHPSGAVEIAPDLAPDLVLDRSKKEA